LNEVYVTIQKLRSMYMYMYIVVSESAVALSI